MYLTFFKNDLAAVENIPKLFIGKRKEKEDRGKKKESLRMKYLLIVGSVMSGIGKGTVASSIGVVLKKSGYNVTAIKIDPYLNLDSGTISPFEHGECYVLEDGGETDLDLGNYERFLHVNLTRDHNITTGKIYQKVLQKERHGDYLGKTVQIVPHITDEIQEWIRRTSLIPISSNLDGGDKYKAEICLIELGGTVGDLESNQYTEALRQFRHGCNKEDFFVVNVCYLPMLRGELKTKPAQNGLAKLRECGLNPDLLVVRSEETAGPAIRKKLVQVCNMPLERIIMNEDLGSIYRIPILFSDLGLDRAIISGLRLPPKKPDSLFWSEWNRVATKHCIGFGPPVVRIAVIGKYTGLSDSYLSLTHAIKDAAHSLDVNPHISFIEAEVDTFNAEEFDMALIPGGFGTRGTEDMIKMIRQLRESDIPTLGICLGFQLMVIEWCRNVLGITGAISEEVLRESCQLDEGRVTGTDALKNAVICHLSRDCSEELMGGTMKLGVHSVKLQKGSLAQKIFSSRFTGPEPSSAPDSETGGAETGPETTGAETGTSLEVNFIAERFRHRYGLSSVWSKKIETSGMIFSGLNLEGIGQISEVPSLKWYVGVQFHPEYRTRPLWPHVLFIEWIKAGLNLRSG